jgi:RNA polymerase sigma-70 factor (ECF subfamily)
LREESRAAIDSVHRTGRDYIPIPGPTAKSNDPSDLPRREARILTATAYEHIIPETMAPGSPPGHDPSKGGKRTLGSLLYVSKAEAPVSEEEWVSLVTSIAAGDQRALHALYERAHRLVFTLSVRITNSRETAEELTLDVFYEVWRRASTYDPACGSVVGWLMNQARSRAIDRLRFEQRKKRVNERADGALPGVATSDPHDASERKEQGRLLRQALTVLTPEERRVIETAFFSEMTYQEVAERLNQPLGTVKTRIRAGLLKLRQALNR